MHALAAVHAAGAESWSGDSVTVRRVTGGANNALYRVETDGQTYAAKLCVADGRRRAAREYGALRLLRAAGLDIAPQPVWLDESSEVVPFPLVVYHWLPGEPLGPSPTSRQLAALLESVHSMHALRQDDFEDSDLSDAIFHWFDFEPYLAELRDFMAKYESWLATTKPGGQNLWNRLVRLVDSCTETLTTTAADPSRGCFPLRLCHVDQNLANALWGKDGRLRWVDWEYSGWGDPALDVAEPRWHAALVGLSEAQQTWLRENYRRPEDDPSFDDRLAVWDHLLATRWPLAILRLLWSEYNGPDRVRLTRPANDPVELRARLVRFIERAEWLVDNQGAKS